MPPIEDRIIDTSDAFVSVSVTAPRTFYNPTAAELGEYAAEVAAGFIVVVRDDSDRHGLV